MKKHTKLTALAANAWHALRGGERSPVCGTSTPLTDRGRRAPLLPKAHSKQWPLEDSACTCLLSGAQLERPTNTRCVRSSLLQLALSEHRLVVCVTAATATRSALCRYYGFSGLQFWTDFQNSNASAQKRLIFKVYMPVFAFLHHVVWELSRFKCQLIMARFPGSGGRGPRIKIWFV